MLTSVLQAGDLIQVLMSRARASRTGRSSRRLGSYQKPAGPCKPDTQPEGDTSGKDDTLKLIGVLAMLLDHAGYLLMPESLVLTVAGRIAMPIFAFSLAEGSRHTASRLHYAGRLLAFALLSQPIFSLVFQTCALNILFDLALGLALVATVEHRKFLLLPVFPVLALLLPFDFGPSVWIMTLLFYYRRNLRLHIILQALLVAAHALLTTPWQMTQEWVVKLAAFAGVLLAVRFQSPKWPIVMRARFFYWFYPAHLLVLHLLHRFVSGSPGS